MTRTYTLRDITGVLACLALVIIVGNIFFQSVNAQPDWAAFAEQTYRQVMTLAMAWLGFWLNPKD